MRLRGRNRKLWSGRLILTVAGITVAGLIGAGLAAGQTASQRRPQTAEQAFKNIQALRGIPVDDFMGTMGIMTAALGFDCADCHIGAGTDKVDWAYDTPRKLIARRMVKMVATINHDNFGGTQLVTCWSCHRGRDRPLVTPALENVYGTPPFETDDVFTQVAGQPSADQILDKYIQALGGAQRLAGLTSFVATGTSLGFAGFGGGAQVQIFAKAPNQRTVLIEFKDDPGRGDSTRTFNGRAGWIKTPLAVLTEYEVSGGDLDGARLDAQLSFPGQIKQVLSNWRVGSPATIDDLPGPSSQTSQQSNVIGQNREVQVVQGSGPGGLIATLYFDKESGLLVREVRYGKSPIGRVPTQIDYGDYRDVGGIKMPFRWTFAWLGGRDSIELKEVQTNVPIDAAKFGRPSLMKGR
jgi:photosynthetic reaction center cytochrome c subunit